MRYERMEVTRVIRGHPDRPARRTAPLVVPRRVTARWRRSHRPGPTAAPWADVASWEAAERRPAAQSAEDGLLAHH